MKKLEVPHQMMVEPRPTAAQRAERELVQQIKYRFCTGSSEHQETVDRLVEEAGLDLDSAEKLVLHWEMT